MSDSRTRAEVWSHMLDGTTRMVKVLEMANTRPTEEQAEIIRPISNALGHLIDCVKWLAIDLGCVAKVDMEIRDVEKKDLN